MKDLTPKYFLFSFGRFEPTVIKITEHRSDAVKFIRVNFTELGNGVIPIKFLNNHKLWSEITKVESLIYSL